MTKKDTSFPNKLWNLDCLYGMPLYPDKSVDLIFTDIPFGLSFTGRAENYNRKSRNVIGKYADIPSKNYADFSYAWIRMAKRLLKPNGSMFIISGWTNLRHVLNAIDLANLEVINHIIWKFQFGTVTKNKFVSSHYHCLYVCREGAERKFFRNSRFKDTDVDEKGRSMRYRDMEDVWTIQRENWHGKIKTPNKLPAEIVKKVLAYTTKKNDIVLDPFFGSGQIPIIAGQMGRRFIGFEKVKQYHEFATKRLVKAKLPFER